MNTSFLSLKILPLCAFTLAAASLNAADLFEEPFRVEAGGEVINVEIGHAAPLAVDFDEDGKFDLLVGQFGGGRLRIYRNVGESHDPKFEKFGWFKTGFTDGTVPTGCCVGFGPQLVDLNNNGLKDMVSGSWPGEVYLFQRKPNRMFEKGTTIKKPNGEALNVGNASTVAVADWNGDGLPDLLIGDIDGGVHLVLNRGTATNPVFSDSEVVKAGGAPIALAKNSGPTVADWDGDGVMDLLVGDAAGAVYFYRNIGDAKAPELAAGVELIAANGVMALSPGTVPDRSHGRAKPAVVDWNGDGRLDLLVGDFHYISAPSAGATDHHGNVWVYLQKPDATHAAIQAN